MLRVWRRFMPIVGMRSWSPIDSIDMNFSQNSFVWLESRATFRDDPYLFYGRSPEDGEKNRVYAEDTLRLLAHVTPDDEMLLRDTVDIGRTVISRYVDIFIRLSELRYLAGGGGMKDGMDSSRTLLECLSDLLYSHSDFSLYDSLTGLRRSAYVNPNFEATLKQNATGYYCRSYISENVKYLYLPEMDIIFTEVKDALSSGREIDREIIKTRIGENTRKFFETPLSLMRENDLPPISEILLRAADVIADADFSV